MVFYFVQPGETLYTIAKRYQTTVHALVVANRLDDPNAICPGQALVIPKPGEVAGPPGGIVHRVRPGETIFHLASRFGATVGDILSANQLAHPEFITAGQQLVIPERDEIGHEWPQAGRSPARSGVASLRLAGPPKEAWGLYPGKADRARPCTPVIRYEHIFVGLGDGAYYCVEPAAGRVIWRLPMQLPEGHLCPLASPVVFDGLIYICTPAGKVMAAEALTGHRIWQVGLERPVTLAPAVHDGLLFLVDSDGDVQAFELKTGVRVWSAHLGEAVSQPVCVGDDLIYVVTEPGNLYALCGQDGEILWVRPIPVQPGTTPPAPAFAELLVLVGGRAFDPRTGDPLWEAEVPDGGWDHTPLVLMELLLHGTGALDLFTGRSRWYLDGNKVPPVAHLAGTISHVLGCHGRQLYAWNTEGQPDWSVDLGAEPVGPPALAPGMMAFTMSTGGLKLFRLSEGR